MLDKLRKYFGRETEEIEIAVCPKCRALGTKVNEVVLIHKKEAGCAPDTLAIGIKIRVPVVHESKLRIVR